MLSQKLFNCYNMSDLKECGISRGPNTEVTLTGQNDLSHWHHDKADLKSKSYPLLLGQILAPSLGMRDLKKLCRTDYHPTSTTNQERKYLAIRW